MVDIKKRIFYFKGKSEDELKNLSDKYHVFWGIKSDKIGDVDFTVVGPTGIFTVDAKDYRKCRVGFNGKKLTFNGNADKKNILHQATRESLEIKNILSKQVKDRFYIESVLAFSSNVKLTFGFNKVKNVFVIGKSYLNNLIMSHRGNLSTEKINKVVDVLKPLV
jgi:hypothetical protein